MSASGSSDHFIRENLIFEGPRSEKFGKFPYLRIASSEKKELCEMASVQDLQERIKELENELSAVKNETGVNKIGREKIQEMSSEVVDSNPYRYIFSSCHNLF